MSEEGDNQPEEKDVATPRSVVPMELVATQNVGLHYYTSTIVSWLLLARFQEPKLEWTYTTPYLATTRIKFQELPHEYATTPADLPEPAYLFIFIEAGVRTDFYTSYESNLTVTGTAWPAGYGATYNSAPFSFDTVKVGLKLDQAKIEIKSFKFNGNPLNKMWPFALDGMLRVIILEVDAFAPTSAGAVVRFFGDVWSIDSSYKATAIPFGNFFERKFPRFLLSVSDNYTQFSDPTHILASDFVISDGTISGTPDTTSQTLLVTSNNAHAKEVDYFAGGWLETGTAGTVNFESRGILHSEVTGTNQVTLHLDRPILKALANQTVKLYPGYDGSIDQCENRFSNRINFGGHPYIPNVNPGVKAVKTQEVQGGKKG